MLEHLPRGQPSAKAHWHPSQQVYQQKLFCTTIISTANERFMTRQLLPSCGNGPSRSTQLAAMEQMATATGNCFQSPCPGPGEHTQSKTTGAGSPHGRRHRDVSSYLWGKSKPGSLHVLPKHGAFSTPLCVPTESSCKWH